MKKYCIKIIYSIDDDLSFFRDNQKNKYPKYYLEIEWDKDDSCFYHVNPTKMVPRWSGGVKEALLMTKEEAENKITDLKIYCQEKQGEKLVIEEIES